MTATKLTVVFRDDLAPICPHCGDELDEVYGTRHGVPLFQGRTVVFFCPSCRRVLGVGQERVA
jgi:hypothetical protein